LENVFKGRCEHWLLCAGLVSLNPGQQVEFEIELNRGRTSAVDLRVK